MSRAPSTAERLLLLAQVALLTTAFSSPQAAGDSSGVPGATVIFAPARVSHGAERRDDKYTAKDAAVDVAQAARYLRRSATARRLLARFVSDDLHFELVVNRSATDKAVLTEAHRIVVFWDPRIAMRTSTGGRQSPAIGLLHELVHAVHAHEDADAMVGFARSSDNAYTNREEARTILYGETAVANDLGEDTRRDHEGRDFLVTSPISRKGI